MLTVCYSMKAWQDQLDPAGQTGVSCAAVNHHLSPKELPLTIFRFDLLLIQQPSSQRPLSLTLTMLLLSLAALEANATL